MLSPEPVSGETYAEAFLRAAANATRQISNTPARIAEEGRLALESYKALVTQGQATIERYCHALHVPLVFKFADGSKVVWANGHADTLHPDCRCGSCLQGGALRCATPAPQK